MKTSHSDRCPTCHRRYRRSGEANRRYWALLHIMASKIMRGEYSADQWHLYCKSRFLGCDDVRLPNGNTLTIPRSSADLDVADFSAYMTQVEAFANERGAWLEDEEWAA